MPEQQNWRDKGTPKRACHRGIPFWSKRVWQELFCLFFKYIINKPVLKNQSGHFLAKILAYMGGGPLFSKNRPVILYLIYYTLYLTDITQFMHVTTQFLWVSAKSCPGSTAILRSSACHGLSRLTGSTQPLATPNFWLRPLIAPNTPLKPPLGRTCAVLRRPPRKSGRCVSFLFWIALVEL